MRALIGLGNPGERYSHTRHNVGFACIDAVAEALGESSWKKFQDTQVIELKFEKEKCFLVKPQLFMNNSGKAIASLSQYYNIAAHDLCIIADDVYVAPGTARIRQSGGDGGHNGWRSIIDHLEPDEFWRVRIGVGIYEQQPELTKVQPPLDEYVLHKMPPHDQKQTKKLIDKLVPNLVEWLKHGSLTQETIHL